MTTAGKGPSLKPCFAGFSLAETMVTLLITSVVITASIPVFTQQRQVQDTSDKSVWQRADNNADIYYCPQGNCNIGIGTISPQNKLHIVGDANDSQLYFRKKDPTSDENYVGPYMQFLDHNGRVIGAFNVIGEMTYAIGNTQTLKAFDAIAHENDRNNNISIGYLASYGDAVKYIGNYAGYNSYDSHNPYYRGIVGLGYAANYSRHCPYAGMIGYKAGYNYGGYGIGAEAGMGSLTYGYWARHEGAGFGDVTVGAFAHGKGSSGGYAAVGYGAAYDHVSYGAYVGCEASRETGWEDAVIGYQAAYNGGYINFGYQAGYSGGKFAIGSQALGNNSGGGSFGLGYRAGFNNATIHRYYIANSDTASPLIYGTNGYYDSDANLTVNGRLILAQGYNHASDRRLKNIIGNYDNGLESVLRLKPKKYFFKEHEKFNFNLEEEQVGLLAQEVKKEIPYAVSKGAHDYYAVSYSSIRYALIDAIQELVVKNEALEAKKNMLKARNERNKKKQAILEKRLEKLEKRRLSSNEGQPTVIASEAYDIDNNDNHDYLKISYGEMYAGM